MTCLQLAGFATNSMMLTFTAPDDSTCVDNYAITANANAPSSTTDTSVMISRPAGDVEGATYSVSVSAVDFAGRMGPSVSLDCFKFSAEHGQIVDLAQENYGLIDICIPESKSFEILNLCYTMTMMYM